MTTLDFDMSSSAPLDRRENSLMSKIIEAIYEEGVLKPLEPLNLEEHTKVRLQISNVEKLCQKEANIARAKRIIALARASIEGLSEEELAIMESCRFSCNSGESG